MALLTWAADAAVCTHDLKTWRPRVRGRVSKERQVWVLEPLGGRAGKAGRSQCSFPGETEA